MTPDDSPEDPSPGRSRPSDGELGAGERPPHELREQLRHEPLGPEHTYEVVEESLWKLWSVVDELATIVPTVPKYYRVTIFGSSRMREGDAVYGEVRHLASELAAMGCDIVTGGGPGLMQAANEGEDIGDVEGRTRSFGINIELPHEQAANPFVEKLYPHGTFFSRLHHFVRLSSAFVVVRGGIGTSLEALLVWQLAQVRAIRHRPLVLLGDMWHDLVEWTRRHMENGDRPLVSPGDLDIPICVGTVEEAVDVVRGDKEAWEAAVREQEDRERAREEFLRKRREQERRKRSGG